MTRKNIQKENPVYGEPKKVKDKNKIQNGEGKVGREQSFMKLSLKVR